MNRSVLVILFTLAPLSASPLQNNSPKARDADNRVQVQMRNVVYHSSNDVAVHIRRLGGELIPTREGQIPIFDDKNSFLLQINAGEMAIQTQSMANVLNQYVFSRQDSPVKDVSIQIDKGLLKVKGKLHKKGDITFETEDELSVTDDGKIRMHAKKVRAAHLPVKGFMDLFGIEIADLIKTGKVRGIRAEKDDLILDPEQALPPPHIKGKVTQVRLEGNSIVQVFGNPSSYKWSAVPAQNYMAYSGNRLKFGKLTMEDTDMVLIDPDPRDAFDFYLDHYKDQLVAGYTKTTPTFGLRVFMVDYSKLKHQAPARSKGSDGKK
jgi:hypothetical protein